MSKKPLALVQIDDMARHVQSTLRRCPNGIGDSLVRTVGAVLTHCLRHHLAGNAAHPGVAKVAALSRCSIRQAQYNLRQLEAWEVLFPVADIKGGRRATRYYVNLVALKRALVAIKCNPSEELFEKIDAVSSRLRGATRGAIGGATSGATIAPGIHTENKGDQAKGFRVIGGGRDA
jgi:hypothetical protein